MPAGYPPGDGAAHDGNQRRDRQDSRALRTRRSVVELGRDIVSGIFSSNKPQATLPFPYDEMERREHEGRRVNGGIMYPSSPMAFATEDRRTSVIGNVARRFTMSRRRTRGPSMAQEDPAAPVPNDQEEAPPQSVPMERSYGQSRWNRLKSQVSMPNLNNKRKRSEQDGNPSRSKKRSTFHFRHLSLVSPPGHTAADYRRSIENMQLAGALNEDHAMTSSLFDGVYNIDGAPSQLPDPTSAQQRPSRNVNSNKVALASLEGVAPHDDGRDFLQHRERFAQALGPAVEAFIDRLNRGDVPRALANEEHSAEPEHFSKEQRRTFMYVHEAAQTDGFENDIE